MVDMNEHEVYPSASVVLVVLEIRHPSTEAISKTERQLLKRALAKRTPIMKSAQSVSLQIGPGMASGAPTLTAEEFPKYFNRDMTLSISYQQSSIVIEASAYAGWELFREIIELACEVRTSVTPLDGLDRVGLRYINELRVPEEQPDWSEWVHDELFEPRIGDLAKMPLTQWLGYVVYGEDPGQALALRFGPRQGIAALEPNADLKRPKTVDGGKFFLLDLDSYWVPKGGTPEFETGELLRICNDLHEPVRSLFDGLVTERFKDEVLRR